MSSFLDSARASAGLPTRTSREAAHKAALEAHQQDHWVLAVRQVAQKEGVTFGEASRRLAERLPNQFQAYKRRCGVA